MTKGINKILLFLSVLLLFGMFTDNYDKAYNYVDGFVSVRTDTGRVDVHMSAIREGFTATPKATAFDKAISKVGWAEITASGDLFNGGVYSFPATASTVRAVSDDARDNDTLIIVGLGPDWTEIQEEIVMDGLNAVTGDSFFLRLNNYRFVPNFDTVITTYDTLFVNGDTIPPQPPDTSVQHFQKVYGQVKVAQSVDTNNVFFLIDSTHNRGAVYSVPAGHTAYVGGLSASIEGDGEEEAVLFVYKRPLGGSFSPMRRYRLNTVFDYRVKAVTEPIGEKTDIKLSVAGATDTVTAKASMSLHLKKN